ncbi:MAG: aminoacetone oxidase family FAD-binding enzyme [Arcobacteraceae bacterium]
MIYDVAIIGAGASGLMLASHLKNQAVCLIDANETIGAKIKISGGGKCNITNKYLSFENYLGEKEFIKTVLESFDNNKLLEFLQQNGVNPKIHEKIIKGTYFCNSSSDVIEMFTRLTKHCYFFLNTKVLDVEFEKHFKIKTTKQTIEAKKVVVATGGLSYTSLGASSIAFDIAKKFGHTVKTPNPALVGFTVQKEQFWFKNLSGVSLDVNINVENKSCEASMLFAHKGCSGPAILNASLYWQKGVVAVDFLPNKRIEPFLKSNKLISGALPLPKRFVLEFLNSINLEDKPISKLKVEETEALKTLKNYIFSPAGNFGYTKAEVTKGGICTNEIESFSMQSKLMDNIYFIGENLDVTGELGGYNFQFAFSSAVTCSRHIKPDL